MPARSILTLVFALAGGGSTLSCARPHARTGTVAGDQVTLGDEVHRVGEVRVHKSEETAIVKMLFSAPGEESKVAIIESLEREVRRDEVLAVEGNEPKKLRVTYLEKSKATATNGQPKVGVYPVAGKVFIVEHLVGRTIITHEDGTPLGVGEEEIVASDYKPKNPALEQIEVELGKPMHIGQKVEPLAALLRRSIPPTIEESKVEVVLTGVRDTPLGQVAVFSVAIEEVGPEGDVEIARNLKGELLVRIADRVNVGSDVGGDLVMLRAPSADQPAMKAAGRLRYVDKTEIP